MSTPGPPPKSPAATAQPKLSFFSLLPTTPGEFCVIRLGGPGRWPVKV